MAPILQRRKSEVLRAQVIYVGHRAEQTARLDSGFGGSASCDHTLLLGEGAIGLWGLPPNPCGRRLSEQKKHVDTIASGTPSWKFC